MVFRTTKFNQSLHMWNVGNVVVMPGIFEEASVFNQSLDSWNDGRVQSTKRMFEFI